ncbi:hypothetical protein CAPTEDRAFT_200991 [Capitella teleta]|uniref:Transposable element P transposase-like RNase H domain-containing protein n=1 Tax=Capitella teleta TaxID=283909 RepID=R7U964_CAPTE|nr:hypothetical protein CAPTEDRAFT_200991 [Capitella teleta]|eukprot:ELU02499.1 hypothetical protein CAPTEDRAFT_200991 [Capitella teleta]
MCAKPVKLAYPIPKPLQNGSPGFCAVASRALRIRAKSQQLVCALMMDEMAIRQKMEWKGKQFIGRIDMGTDVIGDSMPLAKEALAMMVVELNCNFKLPIAYFLINGLDAMNLKMLKCLNCNSRNLYDLGFKKPLSIENFTTVCSFLLEAKDYFKGLKDSVNGRSIRSTNCKTGFVGFCVCIESLVNLYNM